MDMNAKAKDAILQEIMDMMDSRMLDGMKAKSPKFGMAKVSIDATDPKLADELKDKLTGADDEATEDPEEKLKEALMGDDSAGQMDKPSSEDDEDLERLKELYSKLK